MALEDPSWESMGLEDLQSVSMGLEDLQALSMGLEDFQWVWRTPIGTKSGSMVLEDL